MTARESVQVEGSRRRNRIVIVVACVLALLQIAAACRVDLDRSITNNASAPDSAASTAPAEREPGVDDEGATAPTERAADIDDIDQLPILGPAPSMSHWHAAYVVRVCDQVLGPFDSTDDPLGIHSHADGLMHIHPFTNAAGFENATLDVFAEAMGFAISEGELTLPSGVVWRDGDACETAPGRVFVDRWAGPGVTGERERIFEDLGSIRFEADREVYQIAFAPEDSAPVVPPALNQLDQVSAPVVTDEVWVDIDPNADLATVKLWAVNSVAETPCGNDAVPERTRTGTPGCYTSVDEQFDRSRAIVGARAVSFNRRAAVELTISEEFRRYLARQLGNNESAALAIEAAGEVVYVVAYTRASIADDLLIVRGGLDAPMARAMARLFAI